MNEANAPTGTAVPVGPVGPADLAGPVDPDALAGPADPAGPVSPDGPARAPRVHYAWVVAGVALLVLLGSAGFRSTPSLMMDALHTEFGWSMGTISSATSVNLTLYGLTAPFAAALMDRFGVRLMVVCALLTISVGSGLTMLMREPWQLVLCWGVLVGLGSGSMAGAFATTITGRWFRARQGLVTGVLTAAGAAGNLVFLPLGAWLVEQHGWRSAVVVVSLAASAVAVPVLLLMRERPADLGLLPYGATEPPPAPAAEGRALARSLRVLRDAARTRAFWLLAGSFAICGATTAGLVGTHFIPAAHDHGLPVTTAASLLALIGVFDVIGTVASGWFTDRFDAGRLLVVYYALRGFSLLLLPQLFMRLAGAADPGVRDLLRARLGGHRPADRRALPAVLRGGRADRLRLGAGLSPDRRRGGGRPGGARPGRARRLRPRLVRGGRALRRRGAALPGPADAGAEDGPRGPGPGPSAPALSAPALSAPALSAPTFSALIPVPRPECPAPSGSRSVVRGG